jgi:hypothetical protein
MWQACSGGPPPLVQLGLERILNKSHYMQAKQKYENTVAVAVAVVVVVVVA